MTFDRIAVVSFWLSSVKACSGPETFSAPTWFPVDQSDQRCVVDSHLLGGPGEIAAFLWAVLNYMVLLVL
jgi:hypothetical protein